MSEDKEIKKRNRRTKIVIEQDVLRAVGVLIEEVGFSNITLTAVAEKAKIEPSVFYRRYANLDELFDRYTQKYDYWLSGLAENIPKDLSEEEAFKWIMQNLVQALLKNKGMQQLLIWELSDDNATTRRTAKLRELINEPLIRMLELKFKDSGIDINVICAMIISGIYYLVLHRKRSRFCDVDFNTKQGKDRLRTGIDQLSSILFAQIQKQNELLQIAERFRNEGVSEEVINKCLRLNQSAN
ncbi:MAG: TetR/AcrR family transcriptional regulator [Bacteroidales bacterium]|nr:TetR/AcrR family transcriptional regulator [Bacteroidales bacterium]